MKILYDHQIFTLQKYGGISKYFSSLIEHISLSDQHSVHTPILFNENENFKGGFNLRVNFKGKSKIYNYLNDTNSKKNLMKTNAFDVFHPTFYSTYYLNYLKIPLIITVHDMTDELITKNNNKLIREKKQLMDAANHVIAVSQNTKNDIIKLYPDINPSKITVSYLATSYEKKIPKNIIEGKKKYILFVGNRSSYKNFILFIKEIHALLLSYNDIYLLCAGGGSFTKEELSIIDALKLENKTIQINFKDDNELESIYRNALCFVFPSLYEGFGIPILESFACGCPAILNNTSSLPEIGSEGAIYFSFFEKDSLTNQIEAIINNNDFREKTINNGYSRLESFSWKKTSEEHVKVYQNYN